MHNISNLFYFGKTLYVFRTVSPSIIRSLRQYIQHYTKQVLWLLDSKQPQNLYDIQSDTKKRELLKTPTKIEEIQEKKIIDRN